MEKQVDNKKITWVIKNFSSIKSASIYSHQFVVGGCKWRLRADPKCKNKALSLYLGVADKDSLPIGWRRHAKFSLTLVNRFSEKLSLLRESTQQWFDQKDSEWGYSEMITHTKLHEKEGFIVNGELIVVAKVDLLEELYVSEESSPVIESKDVNGFQVLPSQVESVKRLFERHLDIASEFRPTNPCLKTVYMNFLLGLTQTLSQSPQELSNDDLSCAGAALAYLRESGFELDWLENKLYELMEKKKKQETSSARLRELEAQIAKERADL